MTVVVKRLRLRVIGVKRIGLCVIGVKRIGVYPCCMAMEIFWEQVVNNNINIVIIKLDIFTEQDCLFKVTRIASEKDKWSQVGHR